MMSSAEIKKELAKKYNANPEGWRVLVGKDLKGYYDFMISHGSDIWILKEFQLNPYQSLGFGVIQNECENEVIKNLRPTHPFGFRPLNQNQVIEVVEAIQKDESIDTIMGRVMQSSPTSLQNITSPIIVEGPVLHSTTPILSESQSELDQKLRTELENLLHRKYPHLLRQFI